MGGSGRPCGGLQRALAGLLSPTRAARSEVVSLGAIRHWAAREEAQQTKTTQPMAGRAPQLAAEASPPPSSTSHNLQLAFARRDSRALSEQSGGRPAERMPHDLDLVLVAQDEQSGHASPRADTTGARGALADRTGMGEGGREIGGGVQRWSGDVVRDSRDRASVGR